MGDAPGARRRRIGTRPADSALSARRAVQVFEVGSPSGGPDAGRVRSALAGTAAVSRGLPMADLLVHRLL